MSEQSQQSFHQYFSTRPIISIIMPSGNRIRFMAGQYVTDNAEEIEFLDAQIKARHPMIYTKSGQETVTKEQLDPLAAVKAKAIAEFLEQQKKQQDPSRDMGNTAASGAGTDVASTKTIAPIIAGSKSGSK